MPYFMTEKLEVDVTCFEGMAPELPMDPVNVQKETVKENKQGICVTNRQTQRSSVRN